MSKISVIIPVYNVEKYLHICIDSIINQTYKNLEIILVDDGSPDNCGKICDDYARKDNRIKVIHKINGGLSDARNVGIENATGKYISFIDSDDYVDKRYFEILYDNLKKNNAEISICSYVRCDEDEDKCFLNKYDENTTILNKYDVMKNLYGELRGKYVTAWGKLFKIDLFEDIKFPKNKIHEDSFITYKLYFKSNCVVDDLSQLYYYRYRNDGIMNKKPTKKRLHDIESIEIQINFYENNNLIDLKKRALETYIYSIIKFYKLFKENKRYDICISIKRQKRKFLKSINFFDFSESEENFIKAPWLYPKMLNIYWTYISLLNKVKK